MCSEDSSNLSLSAVYGFIIFEIYDRKCLANTLYRLSFGVGTQTEENLFCAKTPAWEGD